jgi:hypothetical protein
VVRSEEVEDGHGLLMRYVGMPFSFDVDYNAWRLVTRIVRVISRCFPRRRVRAGLVKIRRLLARARLPRLKAVQ